MINLNDLRIYVIRPALGTIGLYSLAAENLVLYTGIQESQYSALAQFGGGPAAGFWQMERRTHDDLLYRFLSQRPFQMLRQRVMDLAAPMPPKFDQLRSNLIYAAAMVRVHYYRVPQALPEHDDLPQLAAYWKAYYNTPAGAGTEAQFIANVQAAGALLGAVPT